MSTSQILNILFNTFIFFFCLLVSSIISLSVSFIRHGSTIEYCICLASRPIIEQCSFEIDIFLFISSGAKIIENVLNQEREIEEEQEENQTCRET
jgi:hypothetical protein